MNSTQQLALRTLSLSASYEGKSVLYDCSVEIPQGVMAGIVGPNGAGKTTFIKSVLGLIPSTFDAVTFNNSLFAHMRHKIAYIAQRATLDWHFPATVSDMVLMGSYGSLGWFSRPGKKEYAAVHDALKQVGLSEYADRPISHLSGGQQQRALIARSLVQQADIYFLDEPFAGVDIVTEKLLISLFKTLCARGKTIIIVHHDLMTVPLYFDWLVFINKTCIASGPLEQVFCSDNLIKTYGSSVASFLGFLKGSV